MVPHVLPQTATLIAHLLLSVRLPAALAQLGSLLALAKHARLLKETATAHLRQDAITLHLLVETSQQGIEGLALIYDNFSHPISPLSVPILERSHYNRAVERCQAGMLNR
jgi:hypothetical protein